MKRTFSIILILIIIFNFLGTLLTFLFVQKSIKKEVKRLIINSLPEDKLKTFVFPNNIIEQKNLGVIWIHKQEFKYKHRMYDIVREEKIDGNIKYLVYDDSKETDLVKNYLENYDLYNLLANNPKLKLIKLFKFDYLPDIIESYLTIFTFKENLNYHNLDYHFNYKPDLLKPPKFNLFNI